MRLKLRNRIENQNHFSFPCDFYYIKGEGADALD